MHSSASGLMCANRRKTKAFAEPSTQRHVQTVFWKAVCKVALAPQHILSCINVAGQKHEVNRVWAVKALRCSDGAVSADQHSWAAGGPLAGGQSIGCPHHQGRKDAEWCLGLSLSCCSSNLQCKKPISNCSLFLSTAMHDLPLTRMRSGKTCCEIN